MNILILHGPNLNLIGNISAKLGNKITLDKINTGVRQYVRNTELKLKIYQTHKVYQAINFIQRNRNWANGLLFAPMSWAQYEYSIRETIRISDIKTIQLLFNDGYDQINEKKSIFTKTAIETITGKPNTVYIDGIKFLQKLN
jgi:3-dehydroquinate dehydratase-2